MGEEGGGVGGDEVGVGGGHGGEVMIQGVVSDSGASGFGFAATDSMAWRWRFFGQGKMGGRERGLSEPKPSSFSICDWFFYTRCRLGFLSSLSSS